MSLCKDCVTGVRHEGTAEGKWEAINGVETYVATPAGDYAKDKAILFLPDAWGPQSINAQLMADDFARNGFKTFIPDYYNGDPVSQDAFTPGNTFSIPNWITKHGPEVTRPILDRLVVTLKKDGITSFAATGYCFGGRYVFDLAFDNIIKVAAVAHPSLLKSPEDLEIYAAKSKAPLLINSAEVDGLFPLETAAVAADNLLGDRKFAPGYKRAHWEGTKHGFAVRGDLSDAKVKGGKEGAFEETVKWFQKYL